MQAPEAFGKYILLEKLATGGMAEVHLAKNPGIGISKFVAIKKILPQYSENENFIEMFKGEAKIAINLSHSNIVSIHEFGIEQKQFYIVMDFVEGRNLRQILNKLKKTNHYFTIEQIVFIVREVAAGLDHAHRCLDGSTGKPLNIIHRDMSPQNVMVSFEGEVKIVDFGIAKAETQIETTRPGDLKGKFGYMSPEQAEGLQVDLRSDLFSLGIVLWELLANDRLFIANNEINTLRKIRDCQIPPLRKINPNIPAELERIVGQVLAKDRNLRYQTAADFHRDLNRFINRQYPDFLPHDFSVFIKTIFAEEILDARKRLVEYSSAQPQKALQLASAPPASGLEISEPPKGLLPDISEFTVTENEAEDSLGGDFNFGNSHSKESAQENRNAAEKKEKERQRKEEKVKFDADLKAKREELRASAADKSKIEGANTLGKPPPQIRSHSLSVRAPANDLTLSKTGQSYNGDSLTKTNSRYDRDVSAHHSLMPSKSGAFMAVLAVVMIVSSGWYMANPKSFKAQTKPYLSILEDLTGYKMTSEDSSPTKVADLTSTDSTSVKITSTPSGAEIWIDGNQQHDLTPASFDLEPGVHKIRLHLEGHTDSIEQKRIGSAPVQIDRILVEERFGYVSLEVNQPSDIYLGDEKISSGVMRVTAHPILADHPFNLRVVNLANPNQVIQRQVKVSEKQRVALKLAF